MLLTTRNDLCQHCGERKALWTLRWDWEDGDSDEEDWCQECMEQANWPDSVNPIQGEAPR